MELEKIKVLLSEYSRNIRFDYDLKKKKLV